MYKIGDDIDGYCPRCRLNTYQIVSATDGRAVFSVTCRTCRNAFAWKAEVSVEDLRSKQLQKLGKLQRTRTGGPPEVVQRNRKDGEFGSAFRELSKLTGRDMSAELAAPATPQAPSEEASVAAAPAAVGQEAPPDRWRRVTADLGWRSGKPYVLTRTYKTGDVVLHKAHGLGVVDEVLHDNACMVLFRDAQLVMQMGLPPSALER